MNKAPKPLYRKFNKRAAGFHHNTPPGRFGDERNTKVIKNSEVLFMSIGHTREGYDYTPLFRFLLSRVGHNWDEVFSEAIERLDKPEPIFRMVDLHYKNGDAGIVRLGENSYYSKLTVINGILVYTDEHAGPPVPACTCCSYSFNGKRYS